MKHNTLAPKRIIRLNEALPGCIGSLNHVRKVAPESRAAPQSSAPGNRYWRPGSLWTCPTKFAGDVESLSGPRPIGSVRLSRRCLVEVDKGESGKGRQQQPVATGQTRPHG